MSEKKPYYITTAIAYTSGKPHIGNTYEIILADAIARFKRKEGYDVRFQTGTDEHGQKIETRAIEAGQTPKEFVDSVAAEVKRLWDLCNTSYDRFIRTTDPDHERQVQKIFKKLYDKGDIYKGSYKGMYCTECEAFYTNAQLVDGKCPECHGEVHPAEEEAYFFKMSKYADRLIEHINNNPDFIRPVSRKNEMMNNFLIPGLQDLCVSRTSFTWGIPVDFDPKHVVYVWLDALSNYTTGLGYDADGNHGDLYKKYWPADLHLIGKDIIRFHTIYWPIFLMALDEPLPKQVFGHPWLLQGGEKMSKSKGNVIYADDMAHLFGVDAVRYFVLHEMPYENDGVITWELMAERYNSDLANTLGNLVSRTIAMSNKYFNGELESTGVEESVDIELKEIAVNCLHKVVDKMKELRAADAISEIFTLFKRCNKYIDETEPWILAKEEDKLPRLKEVLYNLSESIMIGASLLYSFMPETSEKIAKAFNSELREFGELDKFGLLKKGTKVEANPEMLFARKDVKEVLAETEKIVKAQREEFVKTSETAINNLLKAGKINEAEAKESLDKLYGRDTKAEGTEAIDIEAKPEIEFDDFMKCQFQVGEIIKCEEVPKSKKLLCSQVKVGSKTLQIVSGIRKNYEAKDMVGKKVMVLTNLKPAMLAGVLSQGMLLCAEDTEGNLSLMTPENTMPSGAEIR